MNTRELDRQRQLHRAGMMLGRAQWAAREFAGFDRTKVQRIVEQVCEAAVASAQKYAEWAVRETGFGVVEHKRLKNELCSRGVVDFYADADLVSARVDPVRKLVEIPRPAGVVFALTPSTNPISTVYFTVLLALMTRNVVIISPHPSARACSVDAIKLLARTAHEAGMPDGGIQVVESPNIPLVEQLMMDDRTDLILATGGSAVVRAAYGSGNPALGVGPGNAPVLVTASADLAATAERIVTSKSFDNSVMCTSESVVLADKAIAGEVCEHLRREGGYICGPDERDRLRAYLFPDGVLNTAAIGKEATWIAARAGLAVPPDTRVLVAPFDAVVPEEPFTHEKLSPVLGFHTVAGLREGIAAARAVLRIAGAGHSAVIHSSVPHDVMAYAAQVNALRVVVNAGSGAAAGGFTTNLAPTMTVGTGFVGRSSLGENLGPQHLVDWQQIAYEQAAEFGDFTGLQPWDVTATPAAQQTRLLHARPTEQDALRDEIRRLVLEELREALAAHHG